MINFSVLIVDGDAGDSSADPIGGEGHGNQSTADELETPLLIHCIVATYITFSVLIALLNTLNITAILTCPELKTVTNMFVLSLSCADLLLSPTLIFVNFLPHTPKCLGVIGARVSATILLSVMYTSSGASLFSILAIAIDRYCAVIHPYNYRQLMTPKRATLAILAIWLYCTLFTSTLIAYYIAQTPPSIFVTLSLLSVILPFPVYLGAIVSQITVVLTISVALYIKIFIAIRRRHEASLTLRGRNPQTETVESRRITHTMALVLGALIISWTPYTILSVTVTQAAISRHNWLVYIAMAAILLLYSNSFMNPIIYASRCLAFRRAYWTMVCYACSMIAKRYSRQKSPDISGISMVKSTKTTVSVDGNHIGPCPPTEL